jgi:3-hydroxy-3-methylglutaryl CoA synthase
MYITQRIGNIYTGSLFSTLVGLMLTESELEGKTLALFSYGSGLCSTLMTGKIHKNLLKP